MYLRIYKRDGSFKYIGSFDSEEAATAYYEKYKPHHPEIKTTFFERDETVKAKMAVMDLDIDFIHQELCDHKLPKYRCNICTP